MRRGAVVTVAAGGGFGGKPRPAVIVQSNFFPDTRTITVALATTEHVDAPDLRIRVEPSQENGLAERSRVMVDKLVTRRRSKVARVLGQTEPASMARIDQCLAVLLGLDIAPAA